LIEQLHLNGLSPEKIFDYLQNLSDPAQKAIILQENIAAASIRRHFKKHFNSEEGAKVKLAETNARIAQSRNLYQQGVQIVVDKVNSVSHLVEVAMTRIEEVENSQQGTKKHQLTIQYMNTIKSLIETLGKLTGDLKQEGTIDINFFNNEIANFADIVLNTVRAIDRQEGMNGKLEIIFAEEFGKQWNMYQDRQQKIISGELKESEANTHKNVNTFNENV
jgi:hypothetical protein